MSVILDALKKLDRERSSRRSGTANIAVEILKPDLPRPEKRIPLYAAVAFLTALATAVITYRVVVRGGSQTKSSPPLAMNSPAPIQQVAPFRPTSERVRGAGDEISPPLPETQSPVKSNKPAASLVENKGDEAKIKENVIVKEADVTPQRANIPAGHLPPGSATTSPSLNISAIVWYEEPSKRFAMINGLIVTEGSIVEGMKVVEIYPDRVRFLHHNQHLEIFIK